MRSTVRKQLFRLKDKGISIHIDALISKETGDLVIEGHDTGSVVMAMFDETDYEYWLTVPKQYKYQVFGLFSDLDPQAVEAANQHQKDKDKDRALVTLIQKYFSVHDAVSKLHELCEAQGIPCKFANYI
jgi:hypothetical protein